MIILNRIGTIYLIGICVILVIGLSFFLLIMLKKKKLTKKAVISILFFIIFALFFGFSIFIDSGCSDRFGNTYSDVYQILYYTKNGDTYRISETQKADGKYYDTFVNTKNKADIHADENSFVNKNGYIFFDDGGKLYKETKDIGVYVGADGKVVYGAKFIIWDRLGIITTFNTTNIHLIDPWNDLNTFGLIGSLCISFFIIILLFGIIAKWTTIRYLKFVQLFSYGVMLSLNFMLMLIFVWYVAIPLSIIILIIMFKPQKKQYDMVHEQEENGIFGYNIKSKIMINYYQKSLEEREEINKFFKSHPILFKPVQFALITIGIPLLVTITCWLLGFGYHLL